MALLQQGTSSSDTVDVVKETERLLYKFYEGNVEKLESIPLILQEYKGHEVELVQDLLYKYSMTLDDLDNLLPGNNLGKMLQIKLTQMLRLKQEKSVKKKKRRSSSSNTLNNAESGNSSVEKEKPMQQPIPLLSLSPVGSTSPQLIHIIPVEAGSDKDEEDFEVASDQHFKTPERATMTEVAHESLYNMNATERHDYQDFSTLPNSLQSPSISSPRLSLDLDTGADTETITNARRLIVTAAQERVSPTHLHASATTIIQHLEKQNDELQLSKWNLSQRLTFTEQELANLSATITTTTSNRKSDSNVYDGIPPPTHELESVIESLRSQLTAQKEMNQQLTVQLAAAHHGSDNLKRDVSILHQRNREYKENKTKLELTMSQINNDNTDLRLKLAELEKIDTLKFELNSKNFELNSIKNNIKMLEKQLYDKERIIHHNKQELSMANKAKEEMAEAYMSRMNNQAKQMKIMIENIVQKHENERQNYQAQAVVDKEHDQSMLIQLKATHEKEIILNKLNNSNELNKILRKERERRVEVAALQFQLTQAADYIHELTMGP
jgi:hypothetical protein